MRPPFVALALLVSLISSCHAQSKCRNVPGSAGFPTAAVWHAFNATVSGRLVPVVPTAKYCASLPGGACTDQQWASALFRITIPGSLDQGYDFNPPSLCLRNSTTCGQGDVPIYAVLAETVEDVQAAVKFASLHNLRLVVKSSGHDYLGRSTAPNSLLIHMANFKNTTLTDAFTVGGQDLGPAATVGPGVHLQDIYLETKAHDRVIVGGSAATVSPAGGYLQGAGHSALGPLHGMAVDNALEFQIVVASGELLTVNSISNPDLFFALRGGGAGSWGVIVSATIRTYPTFNATQSIILVGASTNAAAAALAAVHAEHIFDLDSVHGAQYFFIDKTGSFVEIDNATVFWIETFTNTTLDQGTALVTPLINDLLAVPDTFLISTAFQVGIINDLLYQSDDHVGQNLVFGSRFIPATAYQATNASATVAKVYQGLLDAGAQGILGSMVAGGQVAANANISSAVHPGWRTAKSHIIIPNFWNDTTSLAEIDALRHEFQSTQVKILEQLSGPNQGSYSNEADPFEPNFQTTFFGPNYATLSATKEKYDPFDLFIVPAGVGSERWDQWGICTV
ncbi:FAD-binding domain-containing protein [Mycena galopus ATCC 62051]|nr:FAD-binding domain-containing protein [Mycena galopus ATCC 62051]